MVYISANPHINSKFESKSFNGKNHFHKVVDVWDWGWDEKLGTVHPREVNRAVIMSKERYPDRRLLIHYLQPHQPYIGCHLQSPGYHRPDGDRGRFFDHLRRNQHGDQRLAMNVLQEPFRFLNPLFRRGTLVAERMGLGVGNSIWKIREALRLPPTSSMEAIIREVGVSGLREAYLGNLELVLRYVRRIVENLSGTIMITADHGERLGERGNYSHRVGLRDPLLPRVPWFEVQKADVGKESYQNTEEIRIRGEIRRLKALCKL